VGGSVGFTQRTNDFTFSRFDETSGRLIEAGDRTTDRTYQLQASLRQALVDVEAAQNIRSSKFRLEQSQHGLEATEEQLDLDVTQSYYDLLKAERAAHVADEAVELSKEQLRRTESLYELGSVPRADVLQSRVSVARTELDLISARHTVRDNKAQLALVLGFPSDSDLEIDTTVVLPPLERDWDESQLWDWAKQDRGDLNEVLAASHAAGVSAAAAKWSRWPTLDLVLFFSGQGADLNDIFGELTTDATWGFSVTLNANLNPIDQFILGNTVGRVEEAEWTARQEQRRLQKKQLEVRLDIRRAVLAWEEARERHGMAQENVRYARENLRLQRALYEAGGGTILEWNNAQVELTRAKNELLQAEVDLLGALASLERSVGRPIG
jgi:outer membrane protein